MPTRVALWTFIRVYAKDGQALVTTTGDGDDADGRAHRARRGGPGAGDGALEQSLPLWWTNPAWWTKPRVLNRVYFRFGKEPRSTLAVQHVSGNQKLPIWLLFLDDFVLQGQSIRKVDLQHCIAASALVDIHGTADSQTPVRSHPSCSCLDRRGSRYGESRPPRPFVKEPHQK